MDYVITYVQIMQRHREPNDARGCGYGRHAARCSTTSDLCRRGRDGSQAYFAAGAKSQLIYNIPDRKLVVALASADSVPKGSVGFVNDVVLPAEASLSGSTACVGRLE